MTGRYAKGAAKREQILRVALELIAEHGFRGSTLREIGSAVGLSNAGVLHYFGSKEELFAEVLRLRDATSDGDGFDLDRFVDVIEANAEVPGLVHLYASLSAAAVEDDHGAHEFFVQRYRRVRRLMRSSVEAEIDAGRLSPDLDPERVAVVLIALADGLQLQWLIDDSIDMADHVRTVVKLLSR